MRSRNLNLFVVGSFDRRDYDDRIAALTTRKSVDSLSLGTTGDFRDSLLERRRQHLRGQHRRRPAALPRRRSRRPTTTTSYTRKRPSPSPACRTCVTDRAAALPRAARPVGADNLDTTEQFRAGGADGVRAFAPGEGTGDSGALGTAELRLLPPDDWFGRTSREIVFGAFYDAGRIKHRQHPDVAGSTDNVQNWASYAGVGVSAAWVRADRFALRASLARPVVGEQQSDPRSLRLYLQFNWSLL